MTDLSSDELNNLTPLDLSDVSPTNVTSTSLLHGIITIKWPYTSSLQKLTFLLADPDPRKRASGGQVKVTLVGPAAEALDQIESGEELSIAPINNPLVETDDSRRIKWHITFPEGCILIVKDNSPRLYGPPIPSAETTVSSLPRVPTPPIPTQGSPSSQQGVWRTPLKRKFAELTDHSITSSLTEEEEWFGSEPKGGSSGHRRFSGRMRFIGLNDSPTPSTPTSRRELGDENSFAMARRTQVSPALVLRAQNLVSQAILSEKLLHPPKGVGTGVDEMSHAAVQEGSVRPMSTGAASTSGRRSIGERSFEVYHDEEDVMDTSATNILPKELTRPTDVEHGNVPVRPVAEKRPPPTRPQLQQPEAEQLSTDETPHLQITESPSPSAQSEEASNEGLDTFDTSDQLIQPTRRRYYYPESPESSLDRPSEPDRIDYEYPETYADDEELSGEDYEEEEDLHHAGYYAQDRRARIDEEEYYHSDEEEQGEESEEEEERPSQEKGPLVVDLTLDSSEEESEEEEALEDQIVVQRPPRRYEHTDEVMFRSEDEEDEEQEEEEEEEYEDDEPDASSWAGIGSATPFTDVSRPSQHQSPRVEQALNFLLDPTLMAPLPDGINQPVPFNYDSAVPSQPQSMVQSDVQSFPQDLFAQGLDPAMFQHQQSSFQPVINEFEPSTASLLDSVLSLQTDQSTLLTTQQTSFQSTIPDIPQFTPVSSVVPPRTEDGQGVGVVNTAAAEEFLLGLMPMGDLERHNEDNFENQRQREESQEFLPNIVPNTPTVLKPPPSPENRIRTEPTIVPDTTQVDQQQIQLDKSPPPNLQSQETQPVLQHVPRSPSPPPLPDNWTTEGLTTPLAYYPPLAEIRPPSLRLQKENRTVDLIGIIRESSKIAKTKGPDYMLSLAIVDPSTGSETGLSTLLFRPYESALPSNPTKGSAIILTNMKMQSHNHRAQVTSTESSGWILFSLDGEIQDSGPPVEYGDEELLMVRQLQQWWKRNLEKGKGKENVNKGGAGTENGIKGHTNAAVNGNGISAKTRYKIRRGGGKVVNLNR